MTHTVCKCQISTFMPQVIVVIQAEIRLSGNSRNPPALTLLLLLAYYPK